MKTVEVPETSCTKLELPGKEGLYRVVLRRVSLRGRVSASVKDIDAKSAARFCKRNKLTFDE